jgi:2,3-dihydroxybiphenyl 1,2-dioxygenase
MELLGLAYVGCISAKLDEWEDFAQNVLATPTARENGRLLLRMDERVYRFDIRESDEDGLGWLGWEAGSADEVAVWEAHLTKQGVPVERATPEERSDRKVLDFIWFLDPGGIRNEISYGQGADFRPIEFARPMEGYLTGELGMGHAVVGVKDYRANYDFYVDTLGFRVSDIFRGFIAFLHCNPRHHSLALVESDDPGLRHVMMEVHTLDDLGFAMDAAYEREIVTQTLGRHTNDRAVSFYMTTPSGWDIEYGWSGQHVDDEVWAVRQLVGPPSLWGHQKIAALELAPPH